MSLIVAFFETSGTYHHAFVRDCVRLSVFLALCAVICLSVRYYSVVLNCLFSVICFFLRSCIDFPHHRSFICSSVPGVRLCVRVFILVVRSFFVHMFFLSPDRSYVTSFVSPSSIHSSFRSCDRTFVRECVRASVRSCMLLFVCSFI